MIEKVEPYETVVFEKGETSNSFSVSAEINGEIVGCSFPKTDKWLKEYEGSPGYIWRLREIYHDKYVKDKSEDISLGRY